VTRAYLGLGTNLGDRRANLADALATLESAGDLVAVSQVYETDPVGGPEQQDFWNLVVELDTEDGPEELLERCRALEQAAHRVRLVRFGPRTLDVDVLWVDGQERSSEELTVPHPRMFERRFVLAPLSELAPDIATEKLLTGSGGEVRVLGSVHEVLNESK
jgi:2-amino-4-hydroxy-6-hydroxymethyldihydropteridine diphosphokinase